MFGGVWTIRFNVLKNVIRKSLMVKSGEMPPITGRAITLEEEVAADWEAERCFIRINDYIEKCLENGWYDFSVVLGANEYRKFCAYASSFRGESQFVFIRQILGHSVIVVPGNYMGVTFNDPHAVIAFDHFNGGAVK